MRKDSLGLHLKQCKVTAMTCLIEDGMDTDEAAEAIQARSTAETRENDSDRSSILCENDDNDSGNPEKLKKCFISLKRVGYIEKAAKKCYRSILFYTSKQGENKKFIF